MKQTTGEMDLLQNYMKLWYPWNTPSTPQSVGRPRAVTTLITFSLTQEGA